MPSHGQPYDATQQSTSSPQTHAATITSNGNGSLTMINSGLTISVAQKGSSDVYGVERTPKRIKMTPQDGSSVDQTTLKVSGQSSNYKAPSVLYMNQALKNMGAATFSANNMPVSTRRALELGRMSETIEAGAMDNETSRSGYLSIPTSSLPPPETRVPIKLNPPDKTDAHSPQLAARESRGSTNTSTVPLPRRMELTSHSSRDDSARPSPNDTQSKSKPIGVLRNGELILKDNNHSFVSSVSSQRDHDLKRLNNNTATAQYLPTPISKAVFEAVPPSSTVEPVQRPGRKKFSHQFTQEQDHYLIFLKEVKRYGWKEITARYNADLPHREYHTLQSRYSTALNKRDRSHDPPTLTLPSRFASEAAINWQDVHAQTPGPRTTSELTKLQQNATFIAHSTTSQSHIPKESASRSAFSTKYYDQDHSSGAESAPQRERSRRAHRVDYTWPKHHLEVLEHDAVLPEFAPSGTRRKSFSPADNREFVSKGTTSDALRSLDVDFRSSDAVIALSQRPGLRSASTTKLPYLSSGQRTSIRTSRDLQELSRHQCQGSVLHVDFTPSEVRTVEDMLAKVSRTLPQRRHSTTRRRLRHLLQHITESQVLRLVSEIRCCYPSRDKASILSFLSDAKAGLMTEEPRVQRLAAMRVDSRMLCDQEMSVSAQLRQREAGSRSRRGWQTASKPLTYQLKNKAMDSFGPVTYWTGASSDVHAVAWAASGEHFAAAAVAVDDPDSMQYNRPNNLLFGDTSNGSIVELGEHFKKREKSEQGPNSTEAMFVSQDPNLYTTVSSIAFSKSGDLMYSAGYDQTICVWHTERSRPRPALGLKLRVGAQVDMMAGHPTREGILATAAKTTGSKAIRVFSIDEQDISKITTHSYSSSKATSRSDLKILPTALQFEPNAGRLLLAGFGANSKDNGMDTTGDLCMWEIETQTPLHILGSNKNVFDVDFNRNRSNRPLFAVGSVASGNVNRGTRSLLRLYEEHESYNKVRCPLEIECRALDMNDVVWCPYDEDLIAAGCTDGRVYVWDLRWPLDPIRILSHEESLMPLQDGIKHEITDTGVRFLSWGGNATRLYSGSSDGILKVWDVTRSAEDTFIKDLHTTKSGIMSGAFSPDFSKLVLGEVDGSISVLEVGNDDVLPADVPQMHYTSYKTDDIISTDFALAEGNHLLRTGQLKLAPAGGLSVSQVVQGPNYNGPFDSGVDAPFLREQALQFQLEMAAHPLSQCAIPACHDTRTHVTGEDAGDSERSSDRIPDALRLAWTALDTSTTFIPGKSKCTRCSRPARPSSSTNANADASFLCERCSFACLRCGAGTPILPDTRQYMCASCSGEWSIGALGYDTVSQPTTAARGDVLDVPLLTHYQHEASLAQREDADVSFGDEMNALTEYYFDMGIDRPESPPLWADEVNGRFVRAQYG